MQKKKKKKKKKKKTSFKVVSKEQKCKVIISYHNRSFLNVQVQGQHPHQWAPFQIAGLLHGMADLTPDLQVCLSWGLIAESFLSLQSLSVSCFHVILGLPGSRFPSNSMSKAVLTASLECSTCPYQRSLLSFRMRSRSSMPSYASSSLDLVVTMSWGQTLQICLIIVLSFCCRRWRFGFVNGQVSVTWNIELDTRPRVLKEKWREERTGSRSLNFFQASFTRVVVESSQPPAAESKVYRVMRQVVLGHIGQPSPWSASACAHSDQDLRCPLTESLAAVKYYYCIAWTLVRMFSFSELIWIFTLCACPKVTFISWLSWYTESRLLSLTGGSVSFRLFFSGSLLELHFTKMHNGGSTLEYAVFFLCCKAQNIKGFLWSKKE